MGGRMRLRHWLQVGLDALSLANRSHSITAVRLYLLRYRVPAHVGGSFRFRFGVVRYVDAGSLQWQYEEIFAQRGYEVAGLGRTPYIVDCGGNIGLSVIWFKRRYPAARIVVFEPDPSLVDVLESNLRACRVGGVEVVRAAVGSRSGRVGYVSEGSDMGYVAAGSACSVESVRLSERIDEPVDILKVDIEGSEFDVLRDLCTTGRIGLVRNIICEIHGRGEVQEQIGQLWNDLSKAGFRLTVSWARITEFVPGPAEPTPFLAALSGKFVFHLYAWRA
jgi:FkbM family methyltransferase